MRALFVFSVALVLALPRPASAHQKSVSYSKWTLVDHGAVAEVRVRWLEVTSIEGTIATDEKLRRSVVLSYLQDRLTLETEAGVCTPKRGSEVWLPSTQGWLRVEWQVVCDGAPTGLQSRLFRSLTNHVHLATVIGDESLDVVLSPAAPTAALRTDSGEGRASSIGDYVLLGVEHILTGWDHVAFLLLLVVVARRLRDVAILVTGFTAGHSITLAAAALGFVVPHARAVEATIAASIMVVALENTDMERDRGGLLVIVGGLLLFVVSATVGGLTAFWGIALFTACYFALLRVSDGRERLRWVVACLFGFVHGLGFSGVLLEQELQGAQLVRALFGFNVGVELGQVALVVLIWPILGWLRHRNLGRAAADLTSLAGASIGTFALVYRVFG